MITFNAMLKNYLLVALRNIRKNKLYASINVFGLALGLAFCILIFLYVRDEMTYDRFHENGDRIYRVYRTSYHPDGSLDDNDPRLPMPLGPAIKMDLPEVRDFVRMSDNRSFVRAGGEAVEEMIIFADPSILTVFSFPLIQGDPETALSDRGNVVLTESTAQKYFGDEDPLGRRLAIRLYDRFEEFTVTAIAKDPPANSSIPFEILVPFSNITQTWWGRMAADNWQISGFLTFILLDESRSAADLTEKLVSFRQRYYPDEVQDLQRSSAEGPLRRYNLQPLRDIHLSRDIPGGIVDSSNPLYSQILSGIALIVLLIACINFMTLAIGRSAGRAREIGVRKVVGARKMQLAAQFWGEALLLSIIAAIVGMVLVGIFLPVFNELAGKALILDYAADAGALLALLGMVIVTGLAAGSYPALVLSGIRPVESLKNRFRLGGSRRLTRSLVVVQFALSVFLIVSTLVMMRQLNFIQAADVGFDKENVIVIPTKGVDGRRALSLMENDLASRPDIAGITGMSFSFSRGSSSWGFTHEGEQKEVYVYEVEADFLEVMDIDLVDGRGFEPGRPTDSTAAVIINAAMARDFEWTDPVGRIVSGLNEDDPAADPIVIGVTEDFNYKSLHSPVEPVMLTLGLQDMIGNVLVRIRPENVQATLAALKSSWEMVAPEVPFTFMFLDADMERQYVEDRRWSKIVTYASFFAILVACLGLFGLASIAVAGRTKEIGIRKVMGASVVSVTRLISEEFLWLVGLGLVIAAPIGYFGMSRWLESFAYRIEVGPGIFLLAGLVVLLTALGAVIYQAARAALADPVRSLRYE